MSDTIENAYSALAEEFGGVMRTRWGYLREKLKAKPESPIEEAMMIAFLGVNAMCPIFKFEDDYLDLPLFQLVAHVRPQVSIAGYRVDILIEVKDDGKEVARIGVECDGHQYHDASREAAARDKARDRALTSAGIRIMRFTGSEIHRNAVSCANDVLDVILKLSGRRPLTT